MLSCHGPGDRLKAKEGVVEVSTVAVGTRSFQFFSRNASFSQSSQYSPLLVGCGGDHHLSSPRCFTAAAADAMKH